MEKQQPTSKLPPLRTQKHHLGEDEEVAKRGSRKQVKEIIKTPVTTPSRPSTNISHLPPIKDTNEDTPATPEKKKNYKKTLNVMEDEGLIKALNQFRM